MSILLGSTGISKVYLGSTALSKGFLGTTPVFVEGGSSPVDLFYDDLNETIVGAWGVRKLVSAYSGPLLRIRDTDDDSEQDVGFDDNGHLESFTVVGSAAVTTLYDQSGNGADLVSTTATQQPILELTATPTGGPAIKFDGSDDFLRDGTLGTARPYMVATPVLIAGGGGVSGGDTNGLFAGIPNAQPTNSSPWQRLSIIRSGVSTTQWDVFRNASSGSYNDLFLKPASGWGLIGVNVAQGLIHSSLDVLPDSTFTPVATSTYPNNTGMCIGGAGTGDSWSGYVTEAVILDTDDVAPADVRAFLQKIQARYFLEDKQVWRMNTKARFADPSDISHAFAEWTAALTPGGEDIIPTNVVSFHSAADGTQTSSKLFDNNNSTNWWSGNSVSGPYDIGFVLSSGQDIVEMTIRADAGSSGGATPSIFDIYYLKQNGTWQLVKEVDLTSEGVTAGKVFTISLT